MTSKRFGMFKHVNVEWTIFDNEGTALHTKFTFTEFSVLLGKAFWRSVT